MDDPGNSLSAPAPGPPIRSFTFIGERGYSLFVSLFGGVVVVSAGFESVLVSGLDFDSDSGLAFESDSDFASAAFSEFILDWPEGERWSVE